jgi:hypothetical protein
LAQYLLKEVLPMDMNWPKSLLPLAWVGPSLDAADDLEMALSCPDPASSMASVFVMPVDMNWQLPMALGWPNAGYY